MNESPENLTARVVAFPEISYEEWRQRVQDELGDAPWDETLVSRLAGGIEIEPLYTAARSERGPRTHRRPEPAPYLCQSFADPNLESLNRSLRSDLSCGVTGLRLRLDRCARLGLEPSSSLAGVGQDGTTLYRLSDFEAALAGVPDDGRLWLLDAGGNGVPAAAMLLAWIELAKAGNDQTILLFGCDPLSALARDGSLPGPIASVERDVAALIRSASVSAAESRVLAASTVPYREAGADVDQELGFALASGVHYLRAMEREGVEPIRAASELVFVCAAGQDVSLEIAKLRALRTLWSRVLEACGISQPAPAWIHSVALCRSLTRRDPWLNLLRLTSASFAAVLGGADSLEIPGHDSAFGCETARGRRLARNVGHILGAEGYLDRVVDPAAGSYYLETLTAELGRVGWKAFQDIESEGGMLAALRSGWVTARVAERWRRRRRELEGGEAALVGVNVYAEAEPVVAPPDRSDQSQLAAAVRARFESQAEPEEPLEGEMPSPPESLDWCLRAAARGFSLQAMTRALYPVPGSDTVEPLLPRRDSASFETGVAPQ